MNSVVKYQLNFFFQLAPTKTTERLFMFVESMLISHNSKQGWCYCFDKIFYPDLGLGYRTVLPILIFALGLLTHFEMLL